MGRYHIDEVEIEKDDQTLESDNRGFAKRGADQPRQSPIRRKNKLRQEEEEEKRRAETKSQKEPQKDPTSAQVRLARRINHG